MIPLKEEHRSKLIKSTLVLIPGKTQAIYLVDGTKINIEHGAEGAWLKISPTPQYGCNY